MCGVFCFCGDGDWTVGEPINPEAWHWYHDVVGKSRCSVVDTWWQTGNILSYYVFINILVLYARLLIDVLLFSFRFHFTFGPETGGIMMTPLPRDRDAKPGAAMRPFFGVQVCEVISRISPSPDVLCHGFAHCIYAILSLSF